MPTLRGPISLSLAQALDGQLLPTAFAMNFTLPGGVRGTACAPLPACAGGSVVVDGARMAGTVSGDYACAQVGEGVHQLSCAR